MWFPLSLFFALWTSITLLLVKKMTKKLHPLTILVIGGIVNIPFMLLLVQLSGGIPKVSAEFYKFAFLSTILDIVAFIAAIWALKISDISLIGPLAAFGPVLTTLVAAVVLHEIPSPIKFAGILIVVLGAYLLNLKDIKSGILTPFKKLFADKGARLFFLANALWGITPIFQKQAIFETFPKVPLYASFFGGLLLTSFLFPFSITYLRHEAKKIKTYIWLFLILGLFGSLSQWAAFTAFSLTNLGYSAAVFKLSILFSVILGAVFFKEKNLKERMLSAVIILIGTLLLVG